MSRRQVYTVVDVRPASPTIMVFTMRTAYSRRPLAYTPGQYMTLSFEHNGRPTPARCFSIMSSPTEPGLLQFGIRIHGNYTTTAARTLKPGSKVRVGGPYGHFKFDPQRDTTSVFLAGGIGVAPFMSMIRYATRMQLPNNMLLVYSAHDQEDIAFMDELLYTQSVNPHLKVVFAVSGGNTGRLEGLPYITGRITPQAIYSMLGGAMVGPSYFVCGPAGFMDAMVSGLQSYHIPEDNIFTEAFNTSAQRAGSLLGWPSHVYVLTALGMTFLAGSTLVGDVTAPVRAAVTGGNTVSGSVSFGSIGGENGGTGSDGAGGQKQTDAVDPKPVVSISLGASSIVRGASTQLVWNVSGTLPMACNASGGWSGVKETSGTLTVSPSATTTYTLECANGAGSHAASATLAVESAPTAPDISISLDPSTITAGQAATLSWSVSGTSPACNASGGWSGAKAASGSMQVNPSSTTTYSLSCSNSAGSSSKSATLQVNPAPPKSGYKDGTFTGNDATNMFGDVQVSVAISGGKITAVNFVRLNGNDSHSDQINDNASPQLVSQTLSAQNANIDGVSGATYTSNSYKQSLQSALDKAKY